MTEEPSQKSTAASRTAISGENGKSQSNVKSRKRTKTGCLTCRKRRIKCDEGRPTCHNCYKSKRQCEGYQTTRLQFRPSGSEFGAAGMAYSFDNQMGQFRTMDGAPGHFPSILPRPLQQGSIRPELTSPQTASWMQSPTSAEEGHLNPSQMAQFLSRTQMPTANEYIANFPNIVYNSQYGSPRFDALPPPSTNAPAVSFAADGSGIFSPTAANDTGRLSSMDESFLSGPPMPMQAPNPVSPEGHVWNPSIQAYDPGLYTSIPPERFDFAESIVEDELYDVGSDEDATDAMARNEQTGLPLMMSVHGEFDFNQLRTQDTFLNTPNILVHYSPQWHASPLMDPTTARIFGHFIAVTACHLSVGQRRASNPSLLFQPSAVPKSQQGLWTYILPQKALSNQGLMHAMLALASLQIAMLQGTGQHTARKHYHFAIRRNGKAVGSKQRTSLATIATTILLAHFEVWAADHSNWNSHLVGARQLLMEIGFVKRMRQIKKNHYEAAPVIHSDDPYALYLHQRAGPVLQADTPNEALLEQIMGYKVPYGDHGVEKGDGSDEPLSQRELDTYDSYADLFWQYLKQDLYYSTISSYPTLLPYERWGDCPPRAAIGRLDAIYGTSDHLVLLYGRICRFISKDLVRKKQALKVNGGRWRPPPGMFQSNVSRPPGHGPNMPQAGGGGMAGPPSPQGPGFMGMIPAPPAPRMPTAFERSEHANASMPGPKLEEEEELDQNSLDAAFEQALNEWNEIQSVVSTFEAALQSSEWQPLPLQASFPIPTHFGSALQYGDHRIADIWAMFYTAKIIMARVHPAMPPAALMAAAVCAPQTASWANTVGKIVFGMLTPKDNEPLNPTFASVLTQNMFCLFFAGVQYQEPEQRMVCVQRLQYIAEKVGHESAALIAAALETCWINAYKMGRGPEWKRTLGLKVDEGDEKRKTEFRTMERKKDGNTVYIRSDDVRTQFGMGIMGLESDFSKMDIIDGRGFKLFPNQDIFDR